MEEIFVGYNERKLLYETIQDKRKRPLICYFTSSRQGMSGSMSQDVLPFIINQINSIVNNPTYAENKKIDILIMSNGGDPIVSWRIITLLREFFDEINVLIPYSAYSAATLLALGADSIIMNPYGNLGPLDSQLTIRARDKDNPYLNIGYEDIMNFSDFAKDFGIRNEASKTKLLEKLTDEIYPTSLGFGKRSSKLGLHMGEKLLLKHMKNKRKAKKISNHLNTKIYHHGYPVGKTEAKSIGLKVIDNPEIEKLIWEIAQDFINEVDMNNSFFNPNKYFLHKISKNVPKDLIYNKLYTMNEIFILASLESTTNSYFLKNEILAKYNIDNKLNVNLNLTNALQWEKSN